MQKALLRLIPLSLMFPMNASAKIEEKVFACQGAEPNTGLIATINEEQMSGALIKVEGGLSFALGKSTIEKIGPKEIRMNRIPPEIDWSQAKYSRKCFVEQSGYFFRLVNRNNVWGAVYQSLPVAKLNPNKMDCTVPKPQLPASVKLGCKLF